MNTWQLMKFRATERSMPGTAGYLIAVGNSAFVYTDIRENLRDKKASDMSFEADREVSQALVSMGPFEACGLLPAKVER